MPLGGRGPAPVWLCEQQLGRIVKLVRRPSTSRSLASVEPRQLLMALCGIRSSLSIHRWWEEGASQWISSRPPFPVWQHKTMSAAEGAMVVQASCRLLCPNRPTDLRTSAVNQTPVGLEGDVGWIDEGLHFLGRLVAKYKGDQGVGVPVALQDVHVLVSAASRGLRTEKTKIISTEYRQLKLKS